jgi:hypothetical protein
MTSPATAVSASSKFHGLSTLNGFHSHDFNCEFQSINSMNFTGVKEGFSPRLRTGVSRNDYESIKYMSIEYM